MDNRNITTIIVIIGVLALAGIGFAVWKTSQPQEVLTQSPAQNQTSTSPENNNVTPVSPTASAPVVVTDAVTAPYISTVVVKGTVNPKGAVTTYWYDYGQTTDLGTKTKGYLVGSGFTNMYAPAYITGLSSNTTYYFRLSAINSLGTVNGATYSFKTNATPNPTGTAPTTTTEAATDITTTTVNLHGKVNPNGTSSNFWFEYGTSQNFGAVTSMQTLDSSNNVAPVSISISNLQPSTKYYFRLNTQNQFGTINGEILNFTTKSSPTAKAPSVDTNAASAITDSSAKVNANINPNGAQTTYWFEYSDDSLLSNVVVSTTPEQTLDGSAASGDVSATLSNLDNDTKYSVRVVAKNQYGTTRGEVKTFTTKK